MASGVQKIIKSAWCQDKCQRMRVDSVTGHENLREHKDAVVIQQTKKGNPTGATVPSALEGETEAPFCSTG